jgi:hypothetical protein
MNIKVLFLMFFASLCSFAKGVMQNQIGGVGVTPVAQIAANSMKLGYDSELRMKSLLKSIYTDNQGLYNAEKKTIPSKIYMEIQDAALSETSMATITMLLKLRGAGTLGNGVLIGAEELPTTKSAQIFRNNCRHAVSTPGYGVRKLDAAYLSLYPKHVDNLGDWNKDEEDLEIHQALLETFGETLRWGDTAGVCVPNWNANIYVAGLPNWPRGAHPLYSPNVATYTNRIVAAMLASGGGSLAPIPTQTLNQPNLSGLSNFAMARRITPISLPGAPGGKGYILSISEIGSAFLGDPVWSARNLGSLWIQFNNLDEKLQNWTGALGMYKDMLIVVDPRLATVIPGGSSEPYSLTAGYMWHGDQDLRNRDNTFVREANVLHGAGSVWKWYPEKIHFIEQTDDFGALKAIGTACVRGIGSLVLNQQTPVAGSHEQFSSAVMFTTIPDYV